MKRLAWRLLRGIAKKGSDAIAAAFPSAPADLVERINIDRTADDPSSAVLCESIAARLADRHLDDAQIHAWMEATR